MISEVPNVVQRLIDVAGQDFDSYKCRVTNPHITARESIVIGDYIVSLQERIKTLEVKND